MILEESDGCVLSKYSATHYIAVKSVINILLPNFKYFLSIFWMRLDLNFHIMFVWFSSLLHCVFQQERLGWRQGGYNENNIKIKAFFPVFQNDFWFLTVYYYYYYYYY